jgi:aminoglycoside/choline kinase family phosphotransferase
MATQIVLSVRVEDDKVTPYVAVNPYYNNQGYANPPVSASSMKEGYIVNTVHLDILNFATKIIKKDRAQQFEREEN